MNSSLWRRVAASTAVGIIGVAALAACSGEEAPEEEAGPQKITVWTPQVTPERIAAQEAIAAAFTAESGIDVEIVPMAGGDQDQALTTGAASGNVPDVMLHAADRTNAWYSQGLLDSDAAAAVVDALGADTFNSRALDAVTIDGDIAAVPSDGWTHLIVYRQDLFEQAGVEVPTSLEELADAATTIKEKLGITGLAFGTQAGTPSASEAIESTFQTTGCQMVTDGEVTMDSAKCADAAEQFLRLRNSSTAGDFDVTSARAAYLDGKAAMLLFSTHILDELAGFDEAQPLTCAECASDPAFLADNSAFITVLDEKNPAQYGTVISYGIPTGANAEAAQKYIEYVLGDGYLDTLAVATEGRIPLRNGTADNPTEFIDAWGDLGIGPKAEKTSRELYGDDFVTAMADGMNAVQRWGMGTPDSILTGVAFSQGTLAGTIEQLYNGTDPATMVEQMAAAVEDVKASL